MAVSTRGPGCSVCKGRHRAEVDDGLSNGTPPQHLADKTGHSRSAIVRHSVKCVPEAIATAVAAIDLDGLAAGVGLTQAAVDLQRRTLAILTSAERSRSLGHALGAIREARGNLELLGKLTGKLRPESQVNVLVTSPDWLALRERIAAALEPFPDALAAVQEAIGAR